MALARKFQVFVCSTYLDLEKQRQEIFKSLWMNNCIPVGMEGFVPAQEDQWTYIKNRIEESDYFVVIVANRYGSIMPGAGATSVTEAEYIYAKKIGLPIARFVIDPAAPWSTDPTHNSSSVDKDRLDAFKARLASEDGRAYNVAFWNETTLVPGVTAAVQSMMRSVERPGMLRARPVDQDLDQLGVERVHRGLRDVDKTDVLGSGNKRIRIVLNDGYNFFDSNLIPIHQSLNVGARVQVIICHPETPLMEVIAEKSNKPVDRQRRDIVKSVNLLRSQFAKYHNFQLMGHKLYLTYAAFIGDNKCLVDFYFNFRTESGRQDDRVALECVVRRSGDPVYGKITDDFDTFWRHLEIDDSNNLLM